MSLELFHIMCLILNNDRFKKISKSIDSGKILKIVLLKKGFIQKLDLKYFNSQMKIYTIQVVGISLT